MILLLMQGPLCGFKEVIMEKIYLDHASSMPFDPRVFEYTKVYLKDKFGNPSSLYASGSESKNAIQGATERFIPLFLAADTPLFSDCRI